MNTLLALLTLVFSLFGIDLADSAEALCRHTLLPGVCQVKPAVRRQLPRVLPTDCERPQQDAEARLSRCPAPRPRPTT